MLLSEHNIAHYMIDRGYILTKDIVEGKYSVRRQDSRNNNFLLNKEFQPAYFVKQCRTKRTIDAQTLKIEATCYWLANNDPNFKALKAFLPYYHEYNYQSHILITQFLTKAINLSEYFINNQDFPIEIGQKIAQLLATFHGQLIPKKAFDQAPYSLFLKNKPWVFNISAQQLKQWKSTANPAWLYSVELIERNPEFIQLLAAQGENWEASTLCHNDIKFPNLLLEESEEQGNQIRLIDWELADIGDPCGDVSSVFNSFLIHWISNPSEEDEIVEKALEEMHPCISAFWETYCDLLNINKNQQRLILLKSLQFTALKLVHTCFETTVEAEKLQPHSAKLLQLSYNILKSPEEAIASLLGIQSEQE